MNHDVETGESKKTQATDGNNPKEVSEVIDAGKNENKAMVSPKRIPTTMLMGVFLTSLSVLLLEITFTRILSVMLSYHYVFVVISMALLGLGVGGLFSYFTRSRISLGSLPVFGGLFAASIFSSIFGVAKLGASMFLDSWFILVPFFFAGVILSRIFQEYAVQSGKVYAADLTGAAAGALLAVPLLDRLGGINSGLLIGIVAAIASLLLVWRLKTKIWFPALSLISAVALFLTSVYVPATSDIVLRLDLNKELVASLANGDNSGQVVTTRWSSFGRTDLVKYNNTPDIMTIFVDATAGTLMYRFSGDINNPGPAVAGLKADFPGYFPLQYLQPGQKDNAFIIGPGGGRDVLVALMSGIKNITAVEVNPDTVDLMKEYSTYNGGIYTNFPNVKIVTAEGRNYLRQQTDKYDLIMMSLAVTKTSRSPEGFALTENFLLTKNSIADYLDHLTDDGRLVVVTHGPEEVMRLMSLSHAVLENRGITAIEVMNQTYTLGSHLGSVFVLSKNRINPDESYLEHAALHTADMQPNISYLPYIKPIPGADHIQQERFDQCQMLNPALIAMSQGVLSQPDLVSGFASAGYNVSVVTDENPFFYNFEVGIPGTLSSALTLSLLFVLAAIFIPYVWSRKRVDYKDGSVEKRVVGVGIYPIFFSLLGIGFMLAEIPLIQRFTLFLGEPVLTVSVLLFSLLIGAGIGGLTSSRVSPNRLAKKTSFAAIAVAALLVLYAIVTPTVLKQFLGLTLIERALLSAVMLMPLGFVLGFPFPLGIRMMREKGLDGYVPWIWGINGSASVLGSVLAIVLAMKSGFAWAMIAGAICYVVAWLALRRTSPSFEQKPGDASNVTVSATRDTQSR